MFSTGSTEGQLRDIDEGFPSDSLHYTESYDYLSDSDLEDDESARPRSKKGSDLRIPPSEASKRQPQPLRGAGGVKSGNMSVLRFPAMYGVSV